MELTNQDRAQYDEHAIQSQINDTNTDRQDALCDLLANLMHWAYFEGLDFRAELKRAKHHYKCERSELC